MYIYSKDIYVNTRDIFGEVLRADDGCITFRKKNPAYIDIFDI